MSVHSELENIKMLNVGKNLTHFTSFDITFDTGHRDIMRLAFASQKVV